MPANEAHELARLLVELTPAMGRTLAMRLRHPAGDEAMLPPHLLLLRRLRAGSATHGELAAQLRVVPSTLSATLDALEKRGWVSRERDAEDRRVVRVALTDAGHAVLQTTDDVAASALDDLISTLTDEQIHQALAGMRVLRDLFAKARHDEPSAGMRRWGHRMPPVPPGAIPFTMPIPPGFPPPGDILFYAADAQPFEDDDPPATV
jgi:DNA-binding MarR family transcriptional regulator